MIRPFRGRGVCILWLILSVSCSPTWGQLGLGKHKDKEAEKSARPSDKPPDLSENDKKKLAEIEQRPEIKDEIELAWEAQKKHDLEFVYIVNSSTRFDVSGPQYADYRENYGQLYDNPILQRYVNSLGQKLVPKDSPYLYSFKLLLDPIPRAEAFSTGTIYISTGLVSLLDNEAQLAYVLGHEIAHIEKNHFYSELKNAVLERELNQEKEKSAERKRSLFTIGASLVGAGLGGAFGGGRGAAAGAFLGGAGGLISSMILIRSKTTNTEWSTVYENEADEAGFKYVLEQNYDVREVPHLYARMENMVSRDARIGLGFVGKPSRVKERIAHIQTLIGGTYKADIDAKLKAAGLVGSSPDFPVLMSALKRDNGIVALDYDLFAMSRDNLEDAVNLRSNDSRAQAYLGKVIALTGRTPEDRQQASDHFLKAIQYDQTRGAYPEPHLERALFLIGQSNPANQEEIHHELQAYVLLYQREHAGQLPSNMPIIYDYFSLAGDSKWYVSPTAEVSTRYAESLNVTNNGNGGTAVKQVLERGAERTGANGDQSPAVHKKNAAGAPPR